MKKLTILCLLLTSLYVRADMLITEIVEAGGQTQPMNLKIKGDKIRTDISTQMSTIMDSASGDTITIMHPQKSYMKISNSKTKELIEKMKAMQGQPSASPAAPAEKPKLVNTGTKEKVNDYNTDIYTAETPTTKIKYWITTEFPNYSAVQEQIKKMQTSMLSKLGPDAANSAPDTSSVKGLPIKTEITTNGQTVTVTIVSAKDQPIPDADMTVPEGYTEIKMPDMGGAGAGAPQP